MIKIKNKLMISIIIGFIIAICIVAFYQTFSLNIEYSFKSMVYDIEGDYIYNVSSNTSIELYMKYFDLDNCSIEIRDKNNKKILNGYVPNGSKTVVYDASNNVISSYINIIKGDFNSDGIIDMNDFQGMGKCLVSDCSREEYLNKSIDIDGDLEFHINDLVLLDKSINLAYQGISLKEEYLILQSGEQGRLVAVVEPNYGVNMNVKWVSMDEGIATVDDAGRVIGHNEGETKIKATTLDGKYSTEATVKVDNTIQLDSIEGIGYVGGNDLIVKIKAIDYEGISCSVQNSDIASCEIADKKLVLKAKNVGNTSITVTSSLYGQVSYKLDVYSVYLNVMPKYLCTTPGNVKFITVSGFNSGNLTMEASDNEIINSAYMEMYQNRNMLRINFGMKQGRATLKVTEGHANTSNIVTVDVTNMTLSDAGRVTTVGNEVSIDAKGDNLGNISCVSSDTSIGTCLVEGNHIIVTPLAVGVIYVNVYNKFTYDNSVYDCGQSQFTVVVQEG